MISKETMFRIFSEREEKFNLELIERYCEKQAIIYIDYKEIFAITGVRRCGKTHLMYNLINHLLKNGVSKENILYLNFEDERLAFIEAVDLDKIYELFLEFSSPKGKLYFFLDEIQNVPLWEKWLSRMYEKIKFVISGSNSTLLSSEIATAITGRSIELTLYPFSFKEYVGYKNNSLLERKSWNLAETKSKILSLFNEYIAKGGFPEVLFYGKTDLLSEYYKAILLKDIISRYNIKHKDEMEKISLFLLSNFSKPTSLYALEKDHDMGINTIKNYLNYMEKCFLLFFMRKFDYSLKKQNYNAKKVYTIDIALSRRIGFTFTEDKGRIMENLIFLNMKRNNKESYYYKGKGECDFLIKEGLKISEAIQVCHEINNENHKRELDGLLEAMEKYKLAKGTIITYDEEKEINVDGKKVYVVPIWKALLE